LDPPMQVGVKEIKIHAIFPNTRHQIRIKELVKGALRPSYANRLYMDE